MTAPMTAYVPAHGRSGRPTWAIDIGGTKTLLGRLVGGVLTVAAVIRTPDDPAVLAAWLRRQVPGRTARLGVAFPGGLDEDGRVTAWPNRPEWAGFGLREALGRIALAVVLRDDRECPAARGAPPGVAHGRSDR
ncbi:hypothetical protein ACFXP3_27370, partial [Streptomyces sp. NPDC059096]